MRSIRFVCLFVLIAVCVKAQTIPYLEKKVTLNKTSQPLALIFKELNSQTGVVFSYNPVQLNDQRKVTLSALKVPLRLVLDDLLKGTKCTYKLKKNYLIITYNAALKEEEKPILISGYIYNSIDSTLVTNASVYILSGKHTSVSDQYGYFSISYPKQQNSIDLSVAKQNYSDTAMVLKAVSSEKVKIYLKPVAVPVVVDTGKVLIVRDSILNTDTIAVAKKNGFINFWLRLKESRLNLNNISDTFFSKYSISLIPAVSTNKLLSINTVNDYSFNILIGHSKGVKYFELGGLININNGPVSYCQIAGIGNVVSDTVKGVQVGGIFNSVRSNVSGIQVGGIFNKAETVDGMQMGGIFNSSRKKVKGVQVGGVFNKGETVYGMQIGGIFNKAETVDGMQVAGISNTVDTIKGMQLAGIVNRAKYCSGVQLAGIYNRAKNMKGFQLALVNSADSCSGIPFGLFSYVKHGYHKIELSVNELQFVNIGFRTGVERLHNILFVGINNFSKEKMWTYGYGLGATFKLKNRWNLTTELSSQQIQPLNGADVKLNLVSKAFVGIDFVCARKFRIALGPTFNVLTADTKSSYYNISSDMVSPFVISTYANQTDKTVNKLWIGGTISIKFF